MLMGELAQIKVEANLLIQEKSGSFAKGLKVFLSAKSKKTHKSNVTLGRTSPSV